MKIRLAQAGLLAILTAFPILVPNHSQAQVLYGSVVGTVHDASGAVVPQAVVVISDKATGQVRETKTNDAGVYTFGNVLAGTYELRVTAAGFRTFETTGLVVTINNVTRVNVKLEVGSTSEQVTVAATAALLQSDKADIHVELNAKEVTDLPLANYRNYQSLINLVPGATPGVQQNIWRAGPSTLHEYQRYQPEQQHHPARWRR